MNMTIAEIFRLALLNTVLGMGTVFVVLVFISFVISLFKFLPKDGAVEDKKKGTAAAKAAAIDNAGNSNDEDNKLIAVITAAALAYANSNSTSAGGTGCDGYIVRSVRRL